MITINERIQLRMKELGIRSRDLCQKLEINEHNFSPFIMVRDQSHILRWRESVTI